MMASQLRTLLAARLLVPEEELSSGDGISKVSEVLTTKPPPPPPGQEGGGGGMMGGGMPGMEGVRPI